MQIQTILQQTSKETHITRFEAELLLAAILHVNRVYLHAHPEEIVRLVNIHDFQRLVHRRQQGEPIAYILGHREFWSLDLVVTNATLIPRPETELLVETVLMHLPETLTCPILELGTGSGAISIALAKARPQWQIVATDISNAALTVAKANAHRHNAKNIFFVQSDWYNALKKHAFSAIISNPPYVANYDTHLQQGDVRFEPPIALMAGHDGMKAIKAIIDHASDYLVTHAGLFLEHGYQQQTAVAELLRICGFKKIVLQRDFNHLPRFVYAV